MISFVLPAFNEAENIVPTLNEIRSVMIEIGETWEAIIVDDHSTDKMYEVATNLNLSQVRVIRLSRRSGSHIALRAGLLHARGDCVICVSADGQENPIVFGKMISEWKKGSKIVWALRESRNDRRFFEQIFAKAFYRLLSLMTSDDAKTIDLERADFYLLDRVVVDSLNACTELNTSLFGLISWVGFAQSSVEYTRRERRFGRSKWNFKRKLVLATDWILAFSGMPLKLVLAVGLGIGFLGFLCASYVLLNYLQHPDIPPSGWSSLMVVVLLLSGAQLCTLGVLGEYLLRNLNEARRRPMFFVEKSSDVRNDPEKRGSAIRSAGQ